MRFKNPPGNFVDSASFSCDTRKCLTSIVERQKVVLIPLWEGREKGGRVRGGTWEEGLWVCWRGGGWWGGWFCEGISSSLFTVTQSQQTHRGIHSHWDYDNWTMLSHNGCTHWADLLSLTHAEITGDVFSLLLMSILCHIVTCFLEHTAFDAPDHLQVIVRIHSPTSLGWFYCWNN